MRVQPDDPRLRWEGAIAVEHTPAWSQPWRLPLADIALFPPQALQERAAMPAGVRLSLLSDTGLVAGEIEPHAELSPVDLYVDGRWAGSAPLVEARSFRFDAIQGAGERLIELWLPQHGVFRLRSLELSDGATLAPAEDARPRWITYGSSITQCRNAASPSRTWPAIVARRHGLHLTCLGFGGQCHLDPMIAHLIAGLPADYLSMCVGINIYGSSSFNARSFRPAIIGFVHTIRERHPQTPFVVMSPIYSPPREVTQNRAGFTLEIMREEVALAVEALRSRGDAHLHYVDGRDVFGRELAHLLPDDLHPNAEGYQEMGERFSRIVAARYFA